MMAMVSLKRHGPIALATCLLGLMHCFPIQASSETPMGFELRGDAAAGESLYQRHCAACHGPRGQGDGQWGRAFDPGPPDFTAGSADAERFHRATRDGGMAVGVSGAMPAFRHTLSEEQIHDVIAHLMQLAQ